MKTESTKNLIGELAKVGVCETGLRYLQGAPKDAKTLIKLIKAWPEYFQEHSDYALQTIRRFMTPELKAELTGNNILVDHDDPVSLESDRAVFFIGNSNVNVSITDWAVVKIYLFNEAIVRLNTGANSHTYIDAFDKSSVIGVEANSAKVIVYQYDDSRAEGISQVRKSEYKRGDVFNGKELPVYSDFFISQN